MLTWPFVVVGQLLDNFHRYPVEQNVSDCWQAIHYILDNGFQCYLAYYWPTKIYLYRSAPSTTRYKYPVPFSSQIALVQPNNISCKRGAHGSTLKIDPWKMAQSFSQKLSSSSPVQNNGSRTWTGELLDTLQFRWLWMTFTGNNVPLAHCFTLYITFSSACMLFKCERK